MDHDTLLLSSSSFGTFLDTPMDLDVMDSFMFQGYWCETEPASFSPGFIEQVVEIKTTASQPENGDLGIGWWVESCSSVKERLMLAVQYLQEYVEAQEVLIQIWMPTEIDGRSFLTTVDQPFTMNPKSESLASYRNVSISFQLAAEEDLTDSAGLPGRVFLAKFPEWTPDVRYFRRDECPRKSYAKLYNISGCLAIPVFDVNGTCLAVVEIVTTTQKISYHLELESVYRALEAVELRGSLDSYPPAIMKPYNEVHQVAVPEILDILQSVCKTHRLPLALTWARGDERGSHQVSEKYAACISTVDSACFIADEDLLGFQVACSEQYLFPDQGIVGKAFTTNQQCFATDVASICKSIYPLSHHAQMFKLGAAVAIPLRSIRTGSVQYVIELFLPRDCHDIEEQKQVWDSLSNFIQQACRTLQVVSNKEPDEAVESKMEASLEESTFITTPEEGPNGVYLSWECPKQEPEEEFKVKMTHFDNNDFSLYSGCVLDFGQLEKTSGSERKFDVLGIRKECKKRQTKSEKTVSLQDLRRYFSGSLKDAAKSIGVCPTTLKRICRQHGINRWPSRQIKKVSHSLRKLQLVVDSVEGAEGRIQIDSFYTVFPELNSHRASGNSPFSSNTMSEKPKELNSQPETDLLSSSSDQNSGVSGDDTDLKKPGAVLNKEPNLLERSQHQTQEVSQYLPVTCDQSLRNGGAFRVKATFAEQNVRFSLQPNWSLRDMKQEIAKRFNIDEFSRIDLKYLDNDLESVLLTCDDDLEECRDIFSSSPNETIKITISLASQPNLGSSLGSTTLC